MPASARVKNQPLWRISVATTPEAEEAIAELLQRLLGPGASSFTDLETGRTTVALHLARKPDSSALRAALSAGLAGIRRCGLKTGAGRIFVRRIRRAEWAEAWKRHFQPIEIGTALLIKPGWSRRRPRKRQAVIVLDPGLGFGTGQHPTTAFCLRQLAARRDPAVRQSFLDIGTGSGILAVAAAKLGYAPVEAFDCDPEAVRVARANARRNRVASRVRLRRADLTTLPAPRAQYDLVCANLIATLLVSERERILSHLKVDGVLVIAGIMKTEFAEVRKQFEAAGLALVASRAEREWHSGAFCCCD